MGISSIKGIEKFTISSLTASQEPESANAATNVLDGDATPVVIKSTQWQVAAGLLNEGYSGDDYGQSKDESDTDYNAMSDRLLKVLNAYVNQTGVRLTLSDNSETATLTAYTGEAFFTVGETTYADGKYTVTLTAVGQSKIDVNLFNEYVRINNNNSQVSPVTTITDNGDGTYTIVFDYGNM